jgi:hypothetical protein
MISPEGFIRLIIMKVTEPESLKNPNKMIDVKEPNLAIIFNDVTYKTQVKPSPLDMIHDLPIHLVKQDATVKFIGYDKVKYSTVILGETRSVIKAQDWVAKKKGTATAIIEKTKPPISKVYNVEYTYQFYTNVEY